MSSAKTGRDQLHLPIEGDAFTYQHGTSPVSAPVDSECINRTSNIAGFPIGSTESRIPSRYLPISPHSPIHSWSTCLRILYSSQTGQAIAVQ